MKRTVIFDLDGTLADTSGDLIAAANACFAALGHDAPLVPGPDDATAFRGGRAMLRLGFARLGLEAAAGAVDREYPRLLAHYGARIDADTRLYPGAMAAVARLSSAGHPVGICTNKPEGLAHTLLSRLGARAAFASLVGADTLPVRKPDPAPLHHAIALAGGDPRHAVLIGDTETDRETARAARLPSVLVTFGPEGRGVARLAPEALLDAYGDLDAVLAGLD